MGKYFILLLALLSLMASCNEPVRKENYDRIKVYPSNTWYWQYKQNPVLLLGASDYHNIFQRDDIVDELELLQAHGGNYVRNTMASREITDMPDAHDITDETILRVQKSDVYTFTDISQNNFQKGELHWERIQYVRDVLKDNPKPITNIKIYGADWSPGNVDFWGNTQEGKNRFWRNILGGCSSARFHRRLWGLGHTQPAMNNVLSMRMLTDEMDFFNHRPMLHLLSEREPNEAFCMAIPGNEYVVYFPSTGEVKLNGEPGKYKARWLDIDSSLWEDPFELELPASIETGEDNHRVLFLK